MPVDAVGVRGERRRCRARRRARARAPRDIRYCGRRARRPRRARRASRRPTGSPCARRTCAFASRAAHARGRALALRRRDRRRAARRDSPAARGTWRPRASAVDAVAIKCTVSRANAGSPRLRRLPARVAQDRRELAERRIAVFLEDPHARRPASSDRAPSAPTRSRRRRRRARRRSRTSQRDSDARRRRAGRPSSRDRCLRTQLISRMSAPWRIRKFAAARFCSNVSAGSGCDASDEPPPEIKQHSVSSARSSAASSSSRAPAARLALSGDGWPASTTSMPSQLLAGQQAVTVARDDHAADRRAPVLAWKAAAIDAAALPVPSTSAGRRASPASAGGKQTAGAAACEAFVERLRQQRARGGSVRRQRQPGRSLLQRRDGRQLLAFEELEERTAAGRDVRDAVADAELLDGRERVAAARDRERFARRDGIRDAARAGRELGVLEHAERAVPHDRAGALQALRIQRRGVGADVEDHLVGSRRRALS